MSPKPAAAVRSKSKKAGTQLESERRSLSGYRRPRCAPRKAWSSGRTEVVSHVAADGIALCGGRIGRSICAASISRACKPQAIINDGTGILVVEGFIVNSTSRKNRFAAASISRVRDERGLEIYNWTRAPLPSPALGPGETLPFRSRLASSPPRNASGGRPPSATAATLVAGLN